MDRGKPLTKPPKSLSQHPKGELVLKRLSNTVVKIWSNGELWIPELDFSPQMQQALQLARGSQQILLGLEQIRNHLGPEAKAAPRSWQSLMLITEGGSERFYRGVEGLIRRHPALLVIKLRCPPEALGQGLYNKPIAIKALGILNRDAMIKTLFFLA